MKTLQLDDGRMIQASKYGQDPSEEERVELTAEEQQMAEAIKVNYPLICILTLITRFLTIPVIDHKSCSMLQEINWICTRQIISS